METSGIVFRPIPCFSGVGFDSHSSKFSFSSSLSFDAGNQFSGKLKLLGSRDSSRLSVVRPAVFSGFSNSGFSDEGHLRYHVSPPVCGTKKIKEQKKKEKKNNPEMATIKKKLKLIKGLSKDLSMFSSMGFGLEAEDGLIGEVKEKKISEAAEVLLAQLKLLRAEEKEMKRKRKEEKARLKAMQMKNEMDCESSSSNSSSSSSSESGDDNECGEVVDMRIDSIPALGRDEPQVKTPVEGTLTSMHSLIKEDKKTVQVEAIENRSSENFRQGCCNKSISTSCRSNGSSSAAVVVPSSQRIEVCMGGKCKKSGAATLMEEFERRVGVGGEVVGCKCMGKCKNGPNVRVLNQCNNDDHDEERVEEGVVRQLQGRRHPTNSLCIGVGLEDVGVIVANLFGEERKDLGPTMAAA